MKKVFFVLLLLINLPIIAQILPNGFKLNLKLNLQDINIKQYNKILKPYFNILAAPVNSNNIISNFISDILVQGDTIWFGTGKGLSRTTNNGQSFQNYYGTEPFGEDDVSGIAIFNNYVVVSTARSELINGESVPTGTGIKVSSDLGMTWNAYPQPVDERYDDTLFYGANPIYALEITVAQQNLSYDIAITKKNLSSDSIIIWITSWAGEFRKSTDFGKTFTRVLLPPDKLDSIYPGGNYTGNNSFQYNPRDNDPGNDNHKCFSVVAENDSTLYVGTAGGINKSTDWGVSWRKYNYLNTGSGSGISGNFVVALEIQRFSGNSILWAATNIGASRTGAGQSTSFSYTSDQGITWSNTLKDEVVFSHNIGFKDNIIFAASDNGIWRSVYNPPNFSWSKPSVIYDQETRDRIFTEAFYAVNSKNDTIWIGSGDGLVRTTENGSPWSGKWKIFRAYAQLQSTNESYAAPNPFSPDDEAVRIYYKTGKTTSSVTIKIFDFGMNFVRTLIQHAPRTNPEIDFTSWDGKRDDGKQVSNGVYFYRIEIDNEQSVWGKILVLQ